MIFSKISMRNRVIISVVLFVVIFIGLLVAATYTDLEFC